LKCQVCGEREAAIHYIEIVDGQKASQWICAECAEKEGITPAEVSPLAHGGLESFLGGMLSTGSAGKAPQAKARLVCDVCGYEYGQLQKKGLLGCSACYASFRRQLLPMLRRYHGDVNHLGKVPREHGPLTSLRREIARMKQLLDEAVAQENYEEAARIRDEIRLQERQMELLADESDPAAPDPEEEGGAPARED